MKGPTMAYNSSQNPLDPTGRSIIAQVAFKGAIELASAGKIDFGSIGEVTSGFTAMLVTEVDIQKETFFADLAERKANDVVVLDTPHVAAPAYNAEQGLAVELGATDAFEVKILGDQHGEIPAWAITQFKAAGVTKVFDNRDEIAGTKKPHFKTPKDADKYGEPAGKGFWPPR